MNKTLFSLVLIFCVGITTAFAQNSETRTFESFEGITTSEGIRVTVRKGSENKATITATGIDLDRVNSEIRYGSLKFDIEGNNKGRIRVEVELTYSGSLKSLSAGSAGKIYVKDGLNEGNSIELNAGSAGYIEIAGGIKANELEVKASSAGKIEIDNATANESDLEASSAGKVTVLGGDVDELNVECSSSGHVYCEGMKANDVNAEASSGGGTKLQVKGSLRANASSGGWVKYKGTPTSTKVNKSSGGSVRSL